MKEKTEALQQIPVLFENFQAPQTTIYKTSQ